MLLNSCITASTIEPLIIDITSPLNPIFHIISLARDSNGLSDNLVKMSIQNSIISVLKRDKSHKFYHF